MNKTLYCISGLGADEKIFDNLELNGVDLKFIPWLRPLKNETIEAYALRMAEKITEKNPLILGVSFGGIMAIEIAKQMNVEKLIIVSSIKSPEEMPRWMRAAGKLKLNKILPIRSYKFTERFDNSRLGVSNDHELEMVRAYRRSADSVYMTWAVDQILNWKNKGIPSRIVHIHGDSDRIFPIKPIKADYILKGATHFMVYNRGKEVGEYIARGLQKP